MKQRHLEINKIRGFITNRPAVPDILKEVFQPEGK